MPSVTLHASFEWDGKCRHNAGQGVCRLGLREGSQVEDGLPAAT